MTTNQTRIVSLASSLIGFAMGCQNGLLPASNPFASLAQEQQAATLRAKSAAAPASEASAQKAVPPATIEGTIELASTLMGHAKPTDTVYVMARDAASQRIVAVTRLFVPEDPQSWPLHFVLQDDRLLGEMLVTLSVRIDKDGDATTKQPGDLVGQVAHEVMAPLRDVRVVVDGTL